MLPSGGTECVLGRSVKCDISLNESTLSGRHLTFTRSDPGGWQVEDFGSSNGSTLDGKPIFPPGEPRALVDGAVLTAGDVHLTYRTAKSVYEMLKKAP
jgi:pSer/pThr/pTyr-binding forkhead associated (FHA) protein